jgi:hypothetical protein
VGGGKAAHDAWDNRHMRIVSKIDQFRWPVSLYRYFGRPEWADDFVRGRLKVSTLQECRRHEDATRRDPREGITFERIDNVATNDPAEAAEVLAMMNIRANVRGLYAHGNVVERRLDDAMVLCFSLEYSDQLASHMGQYCVEVIRTEAFFRGLTDALARHGQVILDGTADRVYYDAHDLNAQNRHLRADRAPGFTKTPDFSLEKEYRMLWVPTNPRAPFLFAAPELYGLSKRIR